MWIAAGARISAAAAQSVEEAIAATSPVYVSAITAWEVGLLVSRGRLQLGLDPQDWFERFAAAPGIRLAALTPAILIASHALPGTPPRDPADRIIAATAQALDATLVTRDRLLLAYGRQGHFRAQAC